MPAGTNEKLVKYSDNGSTLGAVNFVEVQLPPHVNTTRFMHIHRDTPGTLMKITDVFARRGINIAGQYLRTDGEIGYVVTDTYPHVMGCFMGTPDPSFQKRRP